MKNSEILSPKQWSRVKWIAVAIFILSLIGFIDSVYLTSKHFSGEGVVCSLVSGCDEVLTSDYATLGDTIIPISLIGAIYYLTLFILSALLLDIKKRLLLNIIIYITALGVLVSFVLIYIQAFVIEAFCLYCLVSALISVMLFSLGLFGLYKLSKQLDLV